HFFNDDANKIEIEVDKNDDKNDADQIDVDKIDVDQNDVDKIFTFDDEPHNGKPITTIEISPNEKYLITYSNEDCSIVGWNVKDIDKIKLKFHQIFYFNADNKYNTKCLCVSDDKKLAYIYDSKITIIDMNNKDKKDKKIALSFDRNVPYYCTFNLKGEFILNSRVIESNSNEKHNIIWIYSTQTKNNKWE
ncbi:hypothetical protein RhiirA4_474875, partial [Rhizophagus irregularis]